MDSALPNSDSWEVFSETFYCEGRDGLVVLEDGAVMKDMAISTWAVMTWIVVWEGIVKHRKGGVYSRSKNCPNVWLFWKDWPVEDLINYIIIWK
jgi:hypothetical protein